ncbi:hypothetical protein CEXT_809671 [Caerostris extrusa]|uniref:Uncharacterized protein n=1 Tax=Caerostris extrusa TaxID=172846 RepID=A0AAV4MD23_CAEEX|nr:hypothetical protein CEXT_809671 [Caerostris extrusa]
MDIVTHGKLCLVQRLSLCKSGKANTHPFPLFSTTTRKAKSKNLVGTKIRSSNLPCVLMDIVLSSASTTLQEWQSKCPLFSFVSANEENGSAAALSETRNLNESFLKKRQSIEPRREKVCYYGAPLNNWRGLGAN